MVFSKNDFEKLDLRLKSITEQPVEQIELNSDLPPTIEQLEDNNKTYSIMASILFIDIRKSSYLTENSQAKSMVKIYRSFMRTAVDCVRKNGGVTRQFLGDRIMGVFIDSVDETGSINDRSVDKAINAARSLQTVIDYSLNKYLKSNVNDKAIECGIGINYGKVLVTQVGLYGVESDKNKENEVDCVWVGNITNFASKYSDIALGGEIFISESVYKNLSDCYKDVWTRSAKYKGEKVFQGYVTKNYYLDFYEELGDPVKVEQDNTVELDTTSQLSDGIIEIEKLQNKLIQREKDLAVLENRLMRENREYKTKYDSENSAKDKAEEDLEKLEVDRHEIIIKALSFVENLLDGSFFKNIAYIEQIGFERWIKIETFYNYLINLRDEKRSYDPVSSFKFIEVFAQFEKFEKSYEYMVNMAKNNYIWLYINKFTFKWACEQNLGWKVINALEENLQNNKVDYKNQEEYKRYLEELKIIRGF